MELPDWRRPEAAEVHRLYWCDACRFGQIFPRPTQRQVASFYDVNNYYTHNDGTTASAGDTVAISELWLDRLRVHIAWRMDRSDELSPTRVFGLLRQRIVTGSPAVCDLGCGNGVLLAGMRDLGCTVVGVEPDPAARRVATGRGLHVIDALADAGTLPDGLREESFDAVVMSHVLEHCLDPLQAIVNARSLLRPGGSLLCEVPNNEALGLVWSQAAWRWLDAPRHLNFFSASSLRRACDAAGLSVVAISHTGYLRQFTNDWLNDERRIAKSLRDRRIARVRGRLTPLTPGRSWALLLRSALARPIRKYDSVWVQASKPPT
jgi:2-polyprenyl-3-methyl-5-hydroxy-6-metoxy-1,4-benzoquinol methylase